MRISILDLFRFLAALAVVFYHYIARLDPNQYVFLAETTKFGYLGVPFFFIISGFVITASAQNRSAVEFGISRVVRLYPAYWTGVLFTTLVVWGVSSSEISLKQLLTNLTLLNDYLGQENIDDVYWTLQAELKFYGCVFLLLVLGVFDKIKIWLPLWLGVAVCYFFFQQPFFMGWFISPYYSSFFIAGIVFYLIKTAGFRLFHGVLLAGSLFLSSVYGYDQAGEFMKNPEPFERGIAVAVIWLFYLLFFLVATDKISLQNRKIYLLLGGLTYPLYLIHSRAGQVLIEAYEAQLPKEILVLLLFVGMLLLSYLIHEFVEKKFASPLKSFLLSQVGKFPLLKTRGKR